MPELGNSVSSMVMSESPQENEPEYAKRMSWRLIIGFAVLGLIAAAIVLFMVTREVVPDGSIIDVRKLKQGEELQQGEYQRIDSPAGSLIIYRRTPSEVVDVNAYLDYLVDPNSLDSEQPSRARNEYRSSNTDYFIFYPNAVKSGCRIRYNAPSDFEYDEYYTPAPIHQSSHFSESCNRNLYDVSGRVLRTSNYTNELNLTVPKLKWLSDFRVQILDKKPVTEPQS